MAIFPFILHYLQQNFWDQRRRSDQRQLISQLILKDYYQFAILKFHLNILFK